MYVDMKVLVEMCKFARKVVNTSPFKDMVGECHPCQYLEPELCADSGTVKEINPGPDVQTDEQIAQWIKPTFSPTWRAYSFQLSKVTVSLTLLSADTIGSCAMLPRDHDGVVDPSLKVRPHPRAPHELTRAGLRNGERAHRRPLHRAPALLRARPL